MGRNSLTLSGGESLRGGTLEQDQSLKSLIQSATKLLPGLAIQLEGLPTEKTVELGIKRVSPDRIVEPLHKAIQL